MQTRQGRFQTKIKTSAVAVATTEIVTVEAKDAMKLRTYMDFMDLLVFFYKTIGGDIFGYRSQNIWSSRLLSFLLVAGFLNFNILVFGASVYFAIAIQTPETVLAAIAVAPCIGFAFVGNFKQIALVRNKKLLQYHFDELEKIFPNTKEKQDFYKLQHHERIMRRAMIVFIILSLTYTSTFSLYPACKSFVEYYILGAEKFERRFGFAIAYPYDATGKAWVYWLSYFAQMHGAFVAGVAFLSGDILLVTSITQLNMHYKYISEQLAQYQPNVERELEDIQFIGTIIRHHTKCLELSEHVNTIFSFSLLLNFLTTSLTICFIGFQVTTSTLEDIILYCIFLLASLLQVFIVCYYGDELMTSSLNVGDAAYDQSWFNASNKYKRMLILIICRSQRPSCITPPTFPPLSFNTYMKVISMSYRFYALLRTTYYGD